MGLNYVCLFLGQATRSVKQVRRKCGEIVCLTYSRLYVLPKDKPSFTTFVQELKLHYQMLQRCPFLAIVEMLYFYKYLLMVVY